MKNRSCKVIFFTTSVLLSRVIILNFEKNHKFFYVFHNFQRSFHKKLFKITYFSTQKFLCKVFALYREIVDL